MEWWIYYMKYMGSHDSTFELNLLSDYNDRNINDLYFILQREIKK